MPMNPRIIATDVSRSSAHGLSVLCDIAWAAGVDSVRCGCLGLLAAGLSRVLLYPE